MSVELLQKEALKYKTRYEFKTYSNSAYSSACKQDILDEICAHISNLTPGYWTRDAIREEVIPETMFPFSKITLKISPSKRVFLNKEQIDDLTKLDLTEGKKATM